MTGPHYSFSKLNCLAFNHASHLLALANVFLIFRLFSAINKTFLVMSYCFRNISELNSPSTEQALFKIIFLYSGLYSTMTIKFQ